ncbi:hypothetical protein SKAU_G00427220 [Synaphobranchus kaupii]|uniref:Secreted protein n=1 Tax=Synaphobranchus kaupii TaxID=118154 RepID=A0A9Q1IA90_SYNKA|nr:hypothetical protein SKAU_G00427220 [Synaphobranchus kaupii]
MARAGLLLVSFTLIPPTKYSFCLSFPSNSRVGKRLTASRNQNDQLEGSGQCAAAFLHPGSEDPAALPGLCCGEDLPEQES